MEFADKVVLITGGASGIGRATSLAFAKAGADVALTYYTSAAEAEALVAEIEAMGRRALAFHADLSDPQRVEEVTAETEAKLGPIDVLFANAGGLLQRSSTADTTIEFWRKTFALNVESTFLTCKAVLARMLPRKRGAIVTMASLAAYNGGGPGSAHYAATKGAIVSYTRGIAKEFGPHGIRVNCVAPGLIATRFHDIFSTPEARAGTVAMTPVRREGRPEDVADTVLYLASERAAFLCGEIVQINGGLAMN
jgi:3-oxoacyl-[acyl-carrier protein] reductase